MAVINLVEESVEDVFSLLSIDFLKILINREVLVNNGPHFALSL